MKILFKNILKLILKLIKKIFIWYGYNFEIKFSKEKILNKNNQLNLNIGAGQYVINNFKSLDFYSKHYYPNKKKFHEEVVEYEIRQDNIPYEDNSVDNIYVSHVIEHIEDKYVTKLIKECCRVLKPSGVLRISCPDGKFLFNVSSFSNDYWNWREQGSFSNKQRYNTDWNSIDQYDYLIRELSTPNCRFYNYKIKNNLPNNEELKKLSYKELKEMLTEGLTFREKNPGDHINIHDYDSLYEKGIKHGFNKVIESKKNGSVSISMQGDEFDRTAPMMSLYIEMIK